MEQKTRPNERVHSFGQVAIYTRVSITDQTTLNQRIRLEKYAKLQGWQVEIFEEIDQREIHESHVRMTCVYE